MTQSGQGEDPHLPSVRQPHEGIVLPSDGGGPLMPGTTGDQTTPTGGAPWGQPWGPDSAALPPGGPLAPMAAPGEAWGSMPAAPSAPQQGTDARTPQQPGTGLPLPPEHPGTGILLPPEHPGTGILLPPEHPGTGVPLPPEHLETGMPLPPEQPALGMPLPPEQSAAPAFPPHPGAGALPPRQPPAQQSVPGSLPPPAPQQQPGVVPLPPATEPTQGGQSSFFGQGESLPHDGYGAVPLPPTDAPSPDGTPRTGEAATQYIAPVGPGALPPEQPRANPDETQRLGRVPQHARTRPAPGRHGAPAPGHGASAGHAAQPGAVGTPPGYQQDPDNQPTQYIAPVPAPPPGAPYGIRPGAPGDGGGPGQDGFADRQPPAEFDSLFRTQPPAAGAAGATQQMPRLGQPARGQGRAPYGTGGPGTGTPGHDRAGHGQDGHAPFDDDIDGGRPAARRGKGPLILAAGIAIVVLGVGAGALLSQGSDRQDDKKPVSAAAQAPGDGKPSGTPSGDPAEAQAGELDKLLADSNDSRDAVIGAVANVKSCKNLAQSATDLRNAAKQRGSLITRLSGLAVDELQSHAQLTAALNSAWRASAAADNHYAAWADQVSGNKKACHKGQARTTSETAAGNRSSGEATKAKQRASGLWNTIAKKYGLTTRDKSEL